MRGVHHQALADVHADVVDGGRVGRVEGPEHQVAVEHPAGHPGGHGQLVDVSGGQQQLEWGQRPAGVQRPDVAGVVGLGLLELQLRAPQRRLVPVGRLDEPVQPGLGGRVGLGQGLDLDVEPGHLLLEPGRLGPG
jgi:hypothetical protein